jgi:CRISPR-associated protein Csd1
MSTLAALKACYNRLAEDQDNNVAPYGYSPERISFALTLDQDGRLTQVVDLRDMAGKTPTPRVLQVPQSFKRPGTTPRAFFLWDKASYVLGVGEQPKDRSEEHHAYRLAEEHAAFETFHAQALAGTDDPGLRALLRFLQRWTPNQIDTLDHKEDLLRNPNLVFRLDGERRLFHERPAARVLWARLLAGAASHEGLCLVTGERGPLARLHPSIKGVRGAQSSGASIVSFNLDAFTSYSKDQGENAPVSEQAAFAYTTALNHLLRPGSRNRVQIADASTVFWAESHAPAEEALVWSLFEPPAERDAETDQREPRFDPGEAAKLRNVLNQIAKGRPLRDAAPEIREGTRFFVLGLAPNAARIAVRFWYEDTLGNIARRFGEHYQDLAIEPSPWHTPPAIWRLLYETAVQGKAENIPAHLAGEMMRAILTGGRYPHALLAAVIMRMRSDHAVNGLRAAICKACLNRDARLSGRKEDIPVSLDRANANPGYRLGRLFAVLETIQTRALGGNINATIRDRYYGAASATPASVLPLLLRNANHHLARLRKDGKGGLAFTFEREIGDILDPFSDQLPRNLRIEEQGRFAIGYYHQRFARRHGQPDDSASAPTTDTPEDEE